MIFLHRCLKVPCSLAAHWVGVTLGLSTDVCGGGSWHPLPVPAPARSRAMVGSALSIRCLFGYKGELSVGWGPSSVGSVAGQSCGSCRQALLLPCWAGGTASRAGPWAEQGSPSLGLPWVWEVLRERQGLSAVRAIQVGVLWSFWFCSLVRWNVIYRNCVNGISWNSYLSLSVIFQMNKWVCIL